VRILLFGKTGQIGSRLRPALEAIGEVNAVSSADADFRKPESLREIVRASRPQLIVNAAAYTAVDDAEREREIAEAVNGAAPAVLAGEAARVGAAIVHYSTDYVFDGSKATPYIEHDPTGPLNEYGRSKLHGEQAIARSGAAYLIFRTSWI